MRSTTPTSGASSGRRRPLKTGTPPGSPTPQAAGLYQRNGFRYGGYDCALFGVHYRALIRGAADVTAEELLQVHQSIYRRHFPPALYQRFIQIPHPARGAAQSPGRWMEEEKAKGYGQVAVAGGVAANRRIRADLQAACARSGDRLYLPELKYCGDNAAMIGCQGFYEYQAGHTAGMELNAYANRDISLG